jgi:hypothetical protein
MSFIKKVLIIVIIALFIYIVVSLLLQRSKTVNYRVEKENFSILNSTEQNEFERLKKSDIVLIKNSLDNYSNLPLKEYCIKTSYNTALTGKNINLDMVKYLIQRGCRFLDFEVFYIKTTSVVNNVDVTTHEAHVAYSTDNTFVTLNTENSILLSKVLTAVITSAFIGPCPNFNDPLFINLRIKSNNTAVYKAVAAAVYATIKDRLYTDKNGLAINVTKNTLLSDIMGKIILCVDKTVVRNYTNYTSCDKNDKTCYDLTTLTNLQTGSEDLNLIKYSDLVNQCSVPINIMNDNIRTDIKTMKLVVPNAIGKYANPNVKDFIYRYSCQDIAYRFYVNDHELSLYEDFFDDNKSAFVPLSVAIPYFENLTY